MSATASLTSDPDRILEMLRHELGPELLGLLTDPKITNIHANEDGSVFVRTTAGAEVDAGFRLARERRRAILTSCAALLGTVVSAEHPALAGKLAAWSARLQAAVWRSPPRRNSCRASLRSGCLPSPTAAPKAPSGLARLSLGELVVAHRNVVNASAVGSDKSAFAEALLAHLVEQHPEERLVVVTEGTLTWMDA